MIYKSFCINFKLKGGENMKNEDIKYVVESTSKKEEAIVHDQTFFSCGCFGGGTVGTAPH